MKNINKVTILISALLISLIINTSAQNSCVDTYARTYKNYRRGQFESTNNSLRDCVREFQQKKTDYLRNRNGKDSRLVFKVYKLIITSYEQINQQSAANATRRQLTEYFKTVFTPNQVNVKYNQTNLEPLR